MHRSILPVLLFLVGLSAHAAEVQIKIAVVSGSLDVKPVPKHVLIVHGEPLESPRSLSTDFGGEIVTSLPPGRYTIQSAQPLNFEGRTFSWNVSFDLGDQAVVMELSNDNATIEGAQRIETDLKALFKDLQASVVTVFSEHGHGTDFLATDTLLLTNYHVVRDSDWLAVQWDPETKVRAVLVNALPEKDVAVLRIAAGSLPEARAVKFAGKQTPWSLEEGEKVFTIGSPLSQRKIITEGLVSKVEDDAIISDININPGNSGGPLFDSQGLVVGITTFGDFASSGPGVSGIVRTDHALALLDQASNIPTDPTLTADRLPVDPQDSYPLEAIKRVVALPKFDTRPYFLSFGGYDVAFVTPVLRYRMENEREMSAAREQAKRLKGRNATVDVDDNVAMYEWESYVGEYAPVLVVMAEPQLRETGWSMLGRGLLAGAAGYAGSYANLPPAKMRFRTDFKRMALRCDGQEVPPILPGRSAIVVDQRSVVANVMDRTYKGYYLYAADAIPETCNVVTLSIYSEKTPTAPAGRVIDGRTLQRLRSDFRPYLAAREVHQP